MCLHSRFAMEALPLILALFAVLLLITYAPPLVLFLPNLLMGGVARDRGSLIWRIDYDQSADKREERE